MCAHSYLHWPWPSALRRYGKGDHIRVVRIWQLRLSWPVWIQVCALIIDRARGADLPLRLGRALGYGQPDVVVCLAGQAWHPRAGLTWGEPRGTVGEDDVHQTDIPWRHTACEIVRGPVVCRRCVTILNSPLFTPQSISSPLGNPVCTAFPPCSHLTRDAPKLNYINARDGLRFAAPQCVSAQASHSASTRKEASAMEQVQQSRTPTVRELSASRVCACACDLSP